MQRVNTLASDAVTIVDVAREAGVSYATVSRVINNEEYVKPETRARVHAALNSLGYVANRQARSLRGGRTHTIGLLVRDLGTGYIGEIVRGIDGELVNRQYDLMLFTTHWRERREADLVESMTRGMVEGLLLVLPRTPENYLERLRQRKFPHVLIDHQGIDETGPSVGATNWQGAYDATKYLVELGHRRIGLITGPFSMRCALERLQGYRAALNDCQIEAEESLIMEGDFFQPSGYANTARLFAQPDPPTAIFASNDVMAFGAMEAARERGLRIPEDVSIIGFDDTPQAASVHPGLTTVRQPLEEMGKMAASMLFSYLEDATLSTERTLLPTQLIIRQSSAAR